MHTDQSRWMEGGARAGARGAGGEARAAGPGALGPTIGGPAALASPPVPPETRNRG